MRIFGQLPEAHRSMPKNIVIFCDGTWNSPADEEFGVPSITNVRILYRACQDFAESSGKQVIWYQSGVGSLGSAFRRSFEGATGWGIGDAIKRGYTAVAKHYQPGDRIFLFGFSRGAFAARSIAGMIRQVGLIDHPTVGRVNKVYKQYESTVFEYKKNESPDPNPLAPGNVPIHFIGVWDTVGSLGFSFWGWSFNLRFFRNGFHDLSPNSITRHVYHALAMDEIRTSFMPSLWEYPKSKKGKDVEPVAHWVEQAWFRGVHSDIGGGYGERGLSDITLKWMRDNAVEKGLLLRPNALISDDDPIDLDEMEQRKNATLFPRPASRIHRSYQGPLWTSVGGWPRWYPPLERKASTNAQGYLHPSVFKRQEICTSTGSSELRMVRLQPGEERSVEIRADQLWNFTGFVMEEGATYTLRASGYWRDAEGETVGPEGESNAQESALKRLGRFGRRAPRHPWMRLMGLVNHPRDWPWKERHWLVALYYLLIADPKALVDKLFPIENDKPMLIESNKTGMLWAFANDWWKKYDNNTGSVTLTVRRIA